jgi:hypothetical protein
MSNLLIGLFRGDQHHHDDHDKNEGIVLLCLLPQEIPPNYPSSSHQQTKLNPSLHLATFFLPSYFLFVQ